MKRWILVAVAAMGLAGPAEAATYQLTASGSVNATLLDEFGQVNPWAEPAQKMTVRVVFDLDQGFESYTGLESSYYGAISYVSIAIGGIRAAFSPDTGGAIDTSFNISGHPRLSLTGTSYPLTNGEDGVYFSIFFPVLSLPHQGWPSIFTPNSPTIGAIEVVNYTDERSVTGTFTGTVDISPVPIPASAPLMLAALAGLGLFKRRNRHN